MSSFGGVIRHDGEPIPKSWINALELFFGTSPNLIDCSTVFVEVTHGRTLAIQSSLTNRHDLSCQPSFLVNARIDSSSELSSESPLSFSKCSDRDDKTLVIMSYERWGASCVKHLIGDFAIARWDPVLRQLYLAKDALGVHPLYFYSSPLVFAFATNLLALLALPFVSSLLHDEAIADSLEFVDSDDASRTVYTEIRRLPAAHYLILNSNKYSQHCYWNADSVPSIDSMSDDDYARQLRDHIVTSVENRLKDAKKAAVHLSGGLDSSATACIAARYLKQRGARLLAFCSVLPSSYEGPESDERKFIDAVLSQEDNIDVIWLEKPIEHDVFAAANTWFNVLGQPFYSSVSHIEEMLAQAGLQHNVDVVLSGFGGDFFASVPAHKAVRQMIRTGQWRRAASELQAIHREQRLSWRILLKRHVFVALLPDYLIRKWQSIRSLSMVSTNCLKDDFAQRVYKSRGQRSPASIKMSLASTHKLMQFIASPGHIEQPLSNTVQVFAHVFSQSLRFPLLDLRVVEFMLSVPIEQLHQDGWPRSLFRRAMQDILPDTIRLRRDKGGAFDPAIMSRIVYCRDKLTEWAREDGNRKCWQYIDRRKYLASLSAVRPAARAQWQKETFQIIIMSGVIARFIDWHQSNFPDKK